MNVRIWLPVVGLVGRYMVSSDGEIMNAKTGRILRQRIRRRYLSVRLGGKTYMVNRIACEAFYGPPPTDFVAHHLNHCKLDNRSENLSWVSKSTNRRLAIQAGRGGGAHKGERNSNAKMSSRIVKFIRWLDGTDREIASMLGLTRKNVNNIRRRITWKHLH